MVLKTLDGSKIKYFITLGFPTTNNVTEYETLLAGLQLAKECLARSLVVYNDSELVISQVLGNFEVSNPLLVKYLAKGRGLTRHSSKSK
ncbi:hypothetical protein Nepgr_021141 [Nepenthes gracilis]|uniref:RNase H type-1 domain-containing protein n=1 Tax=Nepenthes gracilis TaxID=150966 RepID=A0AAD3SY47_NEPGR|nr:hypothetical protein Nepgr_021141 [Nepenthes gracilis]